MQSTRRRFVTYAALITVILLVVALVAGLGWIIYPGDQAPLVEGAAVTYPLPGNSPDRWERFIFNYQTLIGGVLAIFAGVITVVAMIVVDRMQGQRHNELVALSLRQDKLRLERLLVPHFKTLWRQADALRNPSPEELAVPNEGTSFAKLEQYRQDVVEAATEVLDCLGADNWRASTDLFDGTLTVFCECLRDNAAAISGHAHSVDSEIDLIRLPDYVTRLERLRELTTEEEKKQWLQAQDAESRKRLGDRVKQLSEAASLLRTTIELVTDELRKMARTYGIMRY